MIRRHYTFFSNPPPQCFIIMNIFKHSEKLTKLSKLTYPLSEFLTVTILLYRFHHLFIHVDMDHIILGL